jgi:hypothetical protein
MLLCALAGLAVTPLLAGQEPASVPTVDMGMPQEGGIDSTFPFRGGSPREGGGRGAYFFLLPGEAAGIDEAVCAVSGSMVSR